MIIDVCSPFPESIGHGGTYWISSWLWARNQGRIWGRYLGGMAAGWIQKGSVVPMPSMRCSSSVQTQTERRDQNWTPTKMYTKKLHTKTRGEFEAASCFFPKPSAAGEWKGAEPWSLCDLAKARSVMCPQQRPFAGNLDTRPILGMDWAWAGQGWLTSFYRARLPFPKISRNPQ